VLILGKSGGVAKRSLTDAFDQHETIDVFSCGPQAPLRASQHPVPNVADSIDLSDLVETYADENAGGNEARDLDAGFEMFTDLNSASTI